MLVILPFSLYVGRLLLVYTTDHDHDDEARVHIFEAHTSGFYMWRYAYICHTVYAIEWKTRFPTPNLGMGGAHTHTYEGAYT